MKKLTFFLIYFLTGLFCWSQPNTNVYDKIKVGEITFQSSIEDVLVMYPDARVTDHKFIPNSTEFLVDDLEGFDYVCFSFIEGKLVYIMQYISESYGDDAVSPLLREQIKKIVSIFGNPSIQERSQKRKYEWIGLGNDFTITIDYDWYDYVGPNYVYKSCSIEYSIYGNYD